MNIEIIIQINVCSFDRKAEFALQKVQLPELTAKGMVFDRLAVAYGKKDKIRSFSFVIEFFSMNLSCWIWIWID